MGERAQDVAIADCTGESRSLHDLCGQPALVVSWYGWCPSCEDNAALARSLAETHPDLGVVVVLDEDPLAAPVEPEFCAAYADAHPSAARVWMDPGTALEVYGSTDLVIVLDRDGTLTYVRETSSEESITAAVDVVLGG